MPPVDWTDPCARAEALRKAYYEALQSGGRKMIRYRGPNGEREVQNNTVNLATLKAELQEAEALCAGQTTGNTSRRFAIRAGSMRTEVEPK